MIVMKFGGTSMGDADRIENVAAIVTDVQKKGNAVVIVSAMHKITDLLIDAARFAALKKTKKVDEILKNITLIHTTAVAELNLDKSSQKELLNVIDLKITDLKKALKHISSLGKLNTRDLDLVISFGERLSIRLLTAALNKLSHPAAALEANTFLVTSNDFGAALPLFPETTKKIKPLITKLLAKNTIPVITGFIGATLKGEITTLGRGGSDYSATIIANCLDAEEIWIWKDVDGAMTADPKLIPDAKNIPYLSYNEAAELSYFGAKVLHPLTMVPASIKSIPIRIKNTFKPDFPGTEIMAQANHSHNFTKAISSMTGLSLITLQGKGMIGVPGVAAKLFAAIAAQNINVLFISQASSEYNITFVVKKDQGEKAINALQQTFKKELANKRIETVKKEDGVAIIAVVGDGMRGQPGVAGKIFSALGAAGIRTRAIAEGSSERNISFVVNESDVPAAVQSIHKKLILPS